jgi:outer membrane protein
MRKLFYVVLTIAFLVTTQNLALAADSVGKIGYVDVAKIFDEYKKTQDLDKILEDKSSRKQVQRDGMVQSIRKLKDEAELMSESSREKKQDEIEDRIKELQNFDRDARDELQRERDKMAKDILKEIDTSIQDLGKKEGYTVIFNERMLLYYDQANSLTDKVLNGLNRNYKGSR